MALPKQIEPNKDKIVMLAIALGGLYAAAIKFEFVPLATLKSNYCYIVVGLAALGLWVFMEGYQKKKIKRRPLQQYYPFPAYNRCGKRSSLWYK